LNETVKNTCTYLHIDNCFSFSEADPLTPPAIGQLTRPLDLENVAPSGEIHQTKSISATFEPVCRQLAVDNYITDITGTDLLKKAYLPKFDSLQIINIFLFFMQQRRILCTF